MPKFDLSVTLVVSVEVDADDMDHAVARADDLEVLVPEWFADVMTAEVSERTTERLDRQQEGEGNG